MTADALVAYVTRASAGMVLSMKDKHVLVLSVLRKEMIYKYIFLFHQNNRARKGLITQVLWIAMLSLI